MSDVNDVLGSIQNGIAGIATDIKGSLGTPIGAAIGGAVAGGAVIGAVAIGASAIKSKSSSKRRKSKKKITHTKRGWKQDRARRSKQKWEVAYQKKKRKSSKKKYSKQRKHSRRSKGRGVHFTKNGQPYIILKSGKARFVKK
jgi:hypothetical protein